MTYTDSPEVAARRAEVDAHCGEVGRKYGKGVVMPPLRMEAFVETILDALGVREAAEFAFLDKVDQALTELEPEFAKAVLLQPPALPGHVTPEEEAIIRKLHR